LLSDDLKGSFFMLSIPSEVSKNPNVMADDGGVKSGQGGDNNRSNMECEKRKVAVNGAADDQNALAGNQQPEMSIKQEQATDVPEYDPAFCSASSATGASMAVSPCDQYYPSGDHQQCRNYPYYNHHQHLNPPEVSWSAAAAAAYIPVATSTASTLPTLPWMTTPSTPWNL
jgi:hypothetical protein